MSFQDVRLWSLNTDWVQLQVHALEGLATHAVHKPERLANWGSLKFNLPAVTDAWSSTTRSTTCTTLI